MKTRVIHTQFWKDSYIMELNHKEKMVFVYLLTNENINMCGVYELPDKVICLYLDLTNEELQDIKLRFMQDGKFYFKNGWIKVMNHEKFNSYGKGMQEKALEKELSMIPDFMRDDNLEMGIDTSINTSIHTRPNPKIRNKKTKIIKEDEKIEKIDFSKFEDLTDTVLQEIAEKYEVPFEFVQEKKEDMQVWMGKKKSNRYADYKMALMKWVRDDKRRIKLDVIKNKGRGGVVNVG